MSFKIKPIATFDCPVPVLAPGETQPSTFTAIFKVKGEDELKNRTGDGDEAFLRDVLTGWKDDLQDQDGQPLPFSAENVDVCVKTLWIRNAMLDAYFQHIGGRRGKISR